MPAAWKKERKIIIKTRLELVKYTVSVWDQIIVFGWIDLRKVSVIEGHNSNIIQ